MTDIDDEYLDEFEDDMARLSRRLYAEVGVPMYLVPEDLTRSWTVPVPDPEGVALAEQFTAVLKALERRNGPTSSADLARVLEVLADRTFLDVPFSSLSNEN